MVWFSFRNNFLIILLPYSKRGQENIDFKKLDAHVHQLKGSSSSIGAQRVHEACIPFRNFCTEQNVEGCLKSLQQVKHEYSLVKSKLETLFKMEEELLASRLAR
ncbi:histidine-containing phosphotransfer protein [Trifolium repens]|nr:histidine-containing phosphotransfer protein [Trifolium repens]